MMGPIIFWVKKIIMAFEITKPVTKTKNKKA